MSVESQNMLASLTKYFNRIKNLASYSAGEILANQSVVIDAPALLDYTATTHNVYSVGLELRIVDSSVTPNPPVIGATGVLSYSIAADGKITIKNTTNATVNYHARLMLPVRK